jgi:uncharacterized membrane protein
MDALQITLRLIHVVGGIFWVGAMVFVAVFLFPAMRDAGPDGAKVAAGITKRGFPVITPIIAFTTVISGFWLLSRASTGFDGIYMKSGKGITYSIGAACAVLAIIVGLAITRPSMMRAIAQQQAAASATGAERDAALASAQAARARAGSSGNVVAILLVITAAAMAVGRYV